MAGNDNEADDMLPLSAVCRANGISPNRLNEWAKTGHLDALDGPRAPRGSGRTFTLRDALTISLLRTASDSKSVQLRDFAQFAHHAAAAWLEFPGLVKQLIVRYYMHPDPDGVVTFRYNDNVHEEPPEPGAQVTVYYDLDAICGPTNQALKDRYFNQPARLARELRWEALNPSITAANLNTN